MTEPILLGLWATSGAVCWAVLIAGMHRWDRGIWGDWTVYLMLFPSCVGGLWLIPLVIREWRQRPWWRDYD